MRSLKIIYLELSDSSYFPLLSYNVNNSSKGSIKEGHAKSEGLISIPSPISYVPLSKPPNFSKSWLSSMRRRLFQAI